MLLFCVIVWYASMYFVLFFNFYGYSFQIQNNSTTWTEDSQSWSDISAQLLPWLMEAEFPYVLALCNIGLAAWHLMCYVVISKRQKQFKDIRDGMEEISLCSFLKEQPKFAKKIFPQSCDLSVSAEQVTHLIKCVSTEIEESEAFKFLMEYVKQLHNSGGTVLYY